MRNGLTALLLGASIACTDKTLTGPEIQDCSLTIPSPTNQPDPVINPNFESWPIDTILNINLPTYDGSGEAVHPDVIYLPNGFGPESWNYWMAVTPYPSGDAEYENPSIFVSKEGLNWSVPSGLQNPLALPPNNSPNSYSHLSDPDIVYDPLNNLLRVYFREVCMLKGTIWAMETMDGVNWSKPTEIMRGEIGNTLSPTVTFNEQWKMWIVNNIAGGDERQFTSTDGFNWSEPEDISIGQFPDNPWHFDIQYIPTKNEYWTVYPISSHGSDLFFARSSDGFNWITYSVPLLRHLDVEQFDGGLYRSTFVYESEEDIIKFWFSGYGYDHRDQRVWNVAALKTNFSRMLNKLEQKIIPLNKENLTI